MSRIRAAFGKTVEIRCAAQGTRLYGKPHSLEETSSLFIQGEVNIEFVSNNCCESLSDPESLGWKARNSSFCFQSGLATLFNAIKLYDTSYHSLGIHFRPVCQVKNTLMFSALNKLINHECTNEARFLSDTKDESCTLTSVELSQSLTIVFEPSVSNNGKQDWSFKTLFNRMVGSSCPLAENSKVYVDVSSNKVKMQMWCVLSELCPDSKNRFKTPRTFFFFFFQVNCTRLEAESRAAVG